MAAKFENIIHIEGEEYSLETEPLHVYLETKGIKIEGYCNCCDDGYVTDWDIIDNNLYLVDIYPCFTDEEGEEIMSMDNLFPNRDNVFASWYSGELTILKGELLEYSYSKNQSIYEEHHYYIIDRGRVVSVRVEDNRLEHLID